ncbi:MAG: hypothetical protein HN580_07400 [Deltaproteobacteria bacterium]|nr:hypothetical protein [Deltaproteobacteria bacterium]MBT4638125.1 hypothetical protein [Deltaproteobacteria bacterium]MBT6502414.1 hypothetical protein [Deltaproteobacteria bacterium]MBT6613375.1 hypothetical protein [Deltaproteobacteria bacterium]MBT7156041.1 hypothetical protein [Deltaproteobacteria bacterium]
MQNITGIEPDALLPEFFSFRYRLLLMVNSSMYQGELKRTRSSKEIRNRSGLKRQQARRVIKVAAL